MRPTRSGWGAIVAGVGLYAIGVALGLEELVVAGAALLLLLVAAVIWVLRPPALSVARQIEPSRVRRGSPALGLVTVTNNGGRRSPRVSVEDRVGEGTVSLDLPPLRPGQKRSSTYRLPTDRRGVFAVGPLVLSQTDPFGLVARGRTFGEAVDLWVHPRSYPVPAAKAGSTVEMDGPMDDTAPEGTIAFQGLRPYVVGDDLRMVHWRTTARLGTLMVKKHVDTNRPQVAVLIDDRARSYSTPETFEEAVEVGASLAEQGLRGGAPVRIDTVSGSVIDFVPRGSSDALDLLAELHLKESGDLERAVLMLEMESGGSAAMLVTGDRLDDDPAALDRLASRYRRVSAMMVGSESGYSSARRVGRLQVCEAAGAEEVLALWAT
jgi:uncharacterized protein (DUF58 family)